MKMTKVSPWYEGRLRNKVRQGRDKEEERRSRSAKMAAKARRRNLRSKIVSDLTSGFNLEESKTEGSSRSAVEVENREVGSNREGNESEKQIQDNQEVKVVGHEEEREDKQGGDDNREEKKSEDGQGVKEVCREEKQEKQGVDEEHNQDVNEAGVEKQEKENAIEVVEENKEEKQDVKEIVEQKEEKLHEKETGEQEQEKQDVKEIVEEKQEKQEKQDVMVIVEEKQEKSFGEVEQEKQGVMEIDDQEKQEKQHVIDISEEEQKKEDVGDNHEDKDGNAKPNQDDQVVSETICTEENQHIQEVDKVDDKGEKHQDNYEAVSETVREENQDFQEVEKVDEKGEHQEEVVIVGEKKLVQTDHQTPVGVADLVELVGEPLCSRVTNGCWPENGWYLGIDDWPLTWTYEEEWLWMGRGLGSAIFNPDWEYISGIGWIKKN